MLGFLERTNAQVTSQMDRYQVSELGFRSFSALISPKLDSFGSRGKGVQRPNSSPVIIDPGSYVFMLVLIQEN